MYDICEAVAPAIERGAFLHLSAPNGAPLYDDDKQPVGVTLRARNSKSALDASRSAANARMRLARANPNFEITVETNETEVNQMLASCTVSWTFDTLDAQPFPCNFDNAVKLWGDDRFRRWRDEALTFVSSEANFTKA